jgi:hypothetical protein
MNAQRPGNDLMQRRRTTLRRYSSTKQGVPDMIGVLIAILLAALVYWLCLALGLPAIVGIIAAILVLIGGVGSGGYGLRTWGGRERW